MAFQQVIANTHQRPFVTIATRREAERELFLSATTRRSIGEPRALAFEWDPDESLLRISADSPDSPGASRIPLGKHGVTVTWLFRDLGVVVPETTRFTATQDGPLAVIIDLSEYRSTP